MGKWAIGRPFIEINSVNLVPSMSIFSPPMIFLTCLFKFCVLIKERKRLLVGHLCGIYSSRICKNVLWKEDRIVHLWHVFCGSGRGLNRKVRGILISCLCHQGWWASEESWGGRELEKMSQCDVHIVPHRSDYDWSIKKIKGWGDQPDAFTALAWWLMPPSSEEASL